MVLKTNIHPCDRFVVALFGLLNRYNVRYGSDGIHDPISWEAVQDQVDSFKKDFVFADIIKTEVETKSMLEWMGCLPMHKFESRHFEETLKTLNQIQIMPTVILVFYYNTTIGVWKLNLL